MLGAIGAGMLSGAQNLISGLISGHAQRKREQDMKRQWNSDNRSNRQWVNEANAKEEAWNDKVQRRAWAAAKVPVIVKQTGKDVVTTKNTGKDVSTQTQTGGVDFKRLIKDAEAAGFNPVTYLNAGGLGAYAWTKGRSETKYGANQQVSTAYGGVTTTYNEHVFDASLVGLSKTPYHVYQKGSAPINTAPSGAEAFAGAIGAGVNTYLAAQQQQDQNAFQRDLMYGQLQGTQRMTHTQPTMRSFTAPAMSSTSGGNSSGGGYLGSSVGSASSPGGYRSLPMGSFGSMNIPANVPSASDLSNEIGEVSDVLWPLAFGQDVWDSSPDMRYKVREALFPGAQKPGNQPVFYGPFLMYDKNDAIGKTIQAARNIPARIEYLKATTPTWFSGKDDRLVKFPSAERFGY